MENSKANLIPLKKPVLDKRRGANLRTFYISRKNLEESIKVNKREPIIRYIKDYPLKGFVKNSIEGRSILGFKEVIEDDDFFNSILNRNNKIGKIFESNIMDYYTSKISLSMFNYVNTVDSVFLTHIKKDLFASSQIDPIETGRRFSNIINFINPSRFKFLKIFQFLVGDEMKDYSYTLHNSILATSFYRTKDNFFDYEFLSYIISDKYIKYENDLEKFSESFDFNLTFIQMLQLYTINPIRYRAILDNIPDEDNRRYLKIFEDISKSSNKFSNYINRDEWNNLPEIIKVGLLSFADKRVISKIFTNKEDISKVGEDVIFSSLALRPDLSDNTINGLFDLYFPRFVDSGMEEINSNDKSFRYFIIQHFFSKMSDFSYFPYDKIGRMNGNHLIGLFLNRVLKNKNRNFSKIKDYIKNNYDVGNGSNKMNVYYPVETIDKDDNQNFIKLEPLSYVTFQRENPSDLEVSVDNNSIITYNDNNYVIDISRFI